MSTFPDPTVCYALKDHLGNTRIIIDENNNELSEHHYYPFGMEMDGPWQQKQLPRYDYLYNGKERQDAFDLGYYNYGARFYDPAIGRFTSVDKFAELYKSHSPYSYVLNNPINAIDPDGNLVIFINGLERNKSKQGNRGY